MPLEVLSRKQILRTLSGGSMQYAVWRIHVAHSCRQGPRFRRLAAVGFRLVRVAQSVAQSLPNVPECSPNCKLALGGGPYLDPGVLENEAGVAPCFCGSIRGGNLKFRIAM